MVTAEDAAFFESKIRPVLVKHCYECHSTEAGKAKGGLKVDTREAIRTGGDSGPAVVPGDVKGSLILAAIGQVDPDLAMPPKGPALSKTVVDDFSRWIREGAIDPRDVASPHVEGKKAEMFWSHQKPVKQSASIDDLIGAKLKEAGFEFSPEAAPSLLLRRLHFDLVGLPPTPDEAQAFSMERWEETVDQLMESPRFGERWGRHWLDIARYAESNGRESNLTFPHAWRYRDYVIDAVNADVPYDRFLCEQIAGDLLPAKNAEERARLLIATGFLALGAKGLNEQNKAQFAADVADEQLDTVSRSVLATSVACARCHDHKSEPFSMEDYYGLVGIFKSTQTFYGNWIDSENNNRGQLIRLPEASDQVIVAKALTAEKVARLKADLAKLNAEEKEQNEYMERSKAEGRDLSGEYHRLLANTLRIYWSRGGVEGALDAVDEQGKPLPLCMGVKDAEVIADSPLFERGEIAHPGKAVKRGFPELLGEGGKIREGQSGRLELAKWLSSPENPLTARVYVNRVWRHLFGAGLVRTVDDFGSSGERPSHPELLDHLAVRFMEGGWSLKRLIKELVMTRTYRQASGLGTEMDPDNRLLSRANRRRLDAEVIRDSMLAVSGGLELSRRSGSLVAELDGQSVSLIGFKPEVPADLDGSVHRSIYLPVIRDHLPDVLEQFDVANPSMVIGHRDVTNVPMQALYLLNGPFVLRQAEALAGRLVQARSGRLAQVELAFQLCFNRGPDAEETRLADAFFEEGGEGDVTRLAAFCQSLMSSAEFRIVD